MSYRRQPVPGTPARKPPYSPTGTHPHIDPQKVMATKEISIRVSDQAAEAYRAASSAERRKLDALLSMRLMETVRSERSLEEVMREMSRRAQERGLTPEKLQEILNNAA